MLPAPARTAAPPSTTSPASWNPAVPPPPVMGAVVGSTVGDGLDEGLVDSLGLPLSEALALWLSLWLAVSLALALPLAEPLAGEDSLGPLAVGEIMLTFDEELDPVQAESATQASTIVRAEPMAVSLTRYAVHAMALRAFIGPPHARQ
jgi:hypothetical protein